jgi:hypothetical protein
MLRPSTHSHDSTPQPGGSMLSDLQAFLTIINYCYIKDHETSKSYVRVV